jgi:GGDEF domain-containing protein
MSGNELEALRNENQLLRLKMAALEDQVESLKRNRGPAGILEELGLVDQSYFSRRLREAVLSASRYARFLCVIQVELPRETKGIPSKNNALETAARLREELRQTDIVAYYESGKVYLLLEEADPHQAVQALRRVSKEMVEVQKPNYALACFPNDSNREETLMELLDVRSHGLRTLPPNGPRVHIGEEVMALFN